MAPYGKIYVDNIENSNGSGVDLLGITTDEATQSLKGYMSAADKTKLDDIDLSVKADLVGGKLSTSQIPDLAVTEFKGAVADETAMLAITGEKGDWVNRADTGQMFIIIGDDPSQASDWASVSYPASPVVSVAGKVGAVTLTHDDIGSGAITASSGSFSGEVSTGTSAAALFTRNYSGSSANLVGAFRAQHEGVDKAVVFCDGSATFVGRVNVGNYTGSEGNLMYEDGGFVARRSDSSQRLFVGLDGSTETFTVARNGSATFVGGDIEFFDGGAAIYKGALNVYRDTGTNAGLIVGTSSGGNNTILKADGSASFAGDCSVGPFNPSLNTDGVFLGSTGGIISQRNSDFAPTATAFAGYYGTTNTSAICVDGSASFAGTVIAGSYPSGSGVEANKVGLIAARRDGAKADGLVILNGGVDSENYRTRLFNDGSATFAGTVSAQGSVLTSDRKFKTNIEPAGSQLSDVVQLGNLLKNWNWKEDAPIADKDSRFLGLIAQEAEEVSPGIVANLGEGEDAYKGVKHDVLVMKLLGAVAEQNALIEELREEINALKG